MSDEVQVIQFELGENQYCIEIDHVTEIVKLDDDDLTPVPNAPDHVRGVMDLRGETTNIVDPLEVLDTADGGANRDQIMVFDGETTSGSMGWLVDEAHRVIRIPTDAIEDAPQDQDGVRGVVNREDGFLIWTDPDLAEAV